MPDKCPETAPESTELSGARVSSLVRTAITRTIPDRRSAWNSQLRRLFGLLVLGLIASANLVSAQRPQQSQGQRQQAQRSQRQRVQDQREQRPEMEREEQRDREPQRGGPPPIRITDPRIPEGKELLARGTVEVTFRVRSEDVTKIRVKVDTITAAMTSDIDINPKLREQTVIVNLLKGENRLILFGFVDGEPDPNISAWIMVTCNGTKCGTAKEAVVTELDDADKEDQQDASGEQDAGQVGEKAGKTRTEPGVAARRTEPAGKQEPAKPKKPGAKTTSITISKPAKDTVFQDVTTVPLEIKIAQKVNADDNIKKVTIRVNNPEGAIKQAVDNQDVDYPDDAGKSAALLKPAVTIGKGKNTITVSDPAHQGGDSASIEITCNGDKCGSNGGEDAKKDSDINPDSQNTIHTRSVVGLEEFAASSSSPQQKLFVEFNLNVPFGGSGPRKTSKGNVLLRNCDPVAAKAKYTTVSPKRLYDQNKEGTPGQQERKGGSKSCPDNNSTGDSSAILQSSDPLDARFWLWLNARITSLPQTSATKVTDVTTVGNFANTIVSGGVKDVTQGFEFNVGPEIVLLKPRSGIPFQSGYGKDKIARLGLSFILGGGAITPFNPQSTAEIFKVNQTVIDRFPNAVGKDFVAFISPDRDRFFRQYYAGLRLKTYYFQRKRVAAQYNLCDSVKKSTPATQMVLQRNPDCSLMEDLVDQFPGIFELTFGQNESVTGGRLRGGVFRLEGFYPLPFVPSVYVFGTALMKLSRTKINNSPLILEPPSGSIPALSDPKVDIETIPQINRDYYRIGVGVDLLHLIRKAGANAEKQAATTTPPKTGGTAPANQ